MSRPISGSGREKAEVGGGIWKGYTGEGLYAEGRAIERDFGEDYWKRRRRKQKRRRRRRSCLLGYVCV